MNKLLSPFLALFIMVLLLAAMPLTANADNEGYYTYSVTDGEAIITACSTSISGDVVIPSTLGGYPVTSIGIYAFSGCDSLTSVVIPDCITDISKAAFRYCDSLDSIIIGNGVTSIGIDAFSYCDSLTSVTIGDSVTSIEQSAFRGCSSLTSIIIPESVTSIGNEAFYYCSSLSSVILGENVVSIGKNAFSNCSMASITIPESVTSIGNAAFYKCSNLTEVTIPHGVTNISDSLFYYCESLTSITIPDSVTSVHYNAFRFCSSLENVYYTGNEAQWLAITLFNGNDFLTDANIIFLGISEEPDYGKVDTWNLILKEDIGVNFQMTFIDEIKADSDAYVEITIAGEITKIPVSLAVDGLQVNVAAAQMSDEISICVVSGNGIRGKTDTYSVKSYADQIIAGDYDDATKTLVKAMLTYGAMAQKYFDYNTDILANADITGVAVENVPETAEELTVNDKISGVQFYGASLVYRGKIAVRYYFTGDISGCTFMDANSNIVTPIEKDNLYYIEIADILPQNLDQQITLSVTDVDGNLLSVSYSPMNYIVRMNEKGSDTLKALVKALYNYHLAAKALQTQV